MRRSAKTLICISLFWLAPGLAPVGTVLAQNPVSSVGFKNELKVPVVVQGWSLVNNMPRRGQPILVNPGKTAFEFNLPANHIRNYSVYDANQPTRVYISDLPIPIGRVDQLFAIDVDPVNPKRVILKKAEK